MLLVGVTAYPIRIVSFIAVVPTSAAARLFRLARLSSEERNPRSTRSQSSSESGFHLGAGPLRGGAGGRVMGSSSAAGSVGSASSPWAGGRNPRAGGEPASGSRSASRSRAAGCCTQSRVLGAATAGWSWSAAAGAADSAVANSRLPTLRARILGAILGSQHQEPQRRVPPRRGARRGEHGVGERCRRPASWSGRCHTLNADSTRCTGPSSGSSPWAGCPASGLAADGAGSGVGHRFSDGWPAAGNSGSAPVQSPGSAAASGARTVHSPSPSAAPGRSPAWSPARSAAAGPA